LDWINVAQDIVRDELFWAW